MESRFVGIDPGLTGYISVLDGDGKYIQHFKTPTLVDTKKIKKRTGKRAGQTITKTKITLDEAGVFDILSQIKTQYRPRSIYVVVERQHPMTGQGLGSTGKTMEGYGFWKGILRGMGFDFYVVGAVEWQKVTSDPKAEDKKAASIASVKKWDKDVDLKKTKRSRIDDHNLADSLCIARFAHHKFKGT